VIKA